MFDGGDVARVLSNKMSGLPIAYIDALRHSG